jgi:cytochrome c biogenesis protein CcdA
MGSGPASVAFAAGLLSVLNPCGISLFPVWIARLTEYRSHAQGDLLERALTGLGAGLIVGCGFAAVFLPLGLAFSVAIDRATAALPWAGVVLGVVLVFIGLWLATGRNVRLAWMPAPRVVTRGGPSGLLIYGAAYATTALGCAFPTFLLAVGLQSGNDVATIGVRLIAFLLGAVGVLTVISVIVVVASGTARIGALAHRISALTPALLVVTGAYIAARQARLALANAGVPSSPQIVPLAVSVASLAVIGLMVMVRIVAPARRANAEPSSNTTARR